MKCKIIKILKDELYIPKFEDFGNSREFEGNSIQYLVHNYVGTLENAWMLITTDQDFLYRVYPDQCWQPIGRLKHPKRSSLNLTFDTLRKANILRLPEFKNSKGLPAHSKSDGSDWSPAQWLQAVIGELGEYANVMKKVERGDLTAEEAKPLIEKELADVMTYLDILAFRVSVDLSKAVEQKFNEVSERVGCSLRIENNEVVRKKREIKAEEFKLPVTVTNKELREAADKLGSGDITTFSINNRKSYVSPTKEELQEELAKIKENVRARIQSGQTKCETSIFENYDYNPKNGEITEMNKVKKLANRFIAENKISDGTRLEIEKIIEDDISNLKEIIMSKRNEMSDVELISEASIIGYKYGKVAKLKIDKLIKDDLTKTAIEIFLNKSKEDIDRDLKQIKENCKSIHNENNLKVETNTEQTITYPTGIVTKITTHYSDGTSITVDKLNVEIDEDSKLEIKNTVKPKMTDEEFKTAKEACRIPREQAKSLLKTRADSYSDLFRQMYHHEWVEQCKQYTYPLYAKRNEITDIFGFEFQNLDTLKQYLFYQVKEMVFENDCMRYRYPTKQSLMFDYFSKQLGTKIVGMLINGYKENKILNPNDTVQFYDDRNVLWNFRLVKSSDKNVEISNT